MQLEAGREGTATLTVTGADTAAAIGSGDVAVLGTPRVLALAEQAAVDAVAGALPDGRTSVGAWVEMEHVAPTKVGATVTARARLEAVGTRRLEFTFVVTEGATEVAHGRHRRAVVSRQRFA